MSEQKGLRIGLVLVIVGTFLLLQKSLHIPGPGPVLLLVGAILFVLSAVRRFRGPLLPACVLLGLGAGFLLVEPLSAWFPEPAALMLGLGCGFLAVAAIDLLAHHVRGPGPRIAGAVLVGVAVLSALARRFDLAAAFAQLAVQLAPYWPWLLVAAGALLIATSLRKKTV